MVATRVCLSDGGARRASEAEEDTPVMRRRFVIYGALFAIGAVGAPIVAGAAPPEGRGDPAAPWGLCHVAFNNADQNGVDQGVAFDRCANANPQIPPGQDGQG